MDVKEFLKADRQWPHRLRVAHAQMQIQRATTDEEFEFWRAVLAANDKGRMASLR
jgi:hypothetical protein